MDTKLLHIWDNFTDFLTDVVLLFFMNIEYNEYNYACIINLHVPHEVKNQRVIAIEDFPNNERCNNPK